MTPMIVKTTEREYVHGNILASARACEPEGTEIDAALIRLNEKKVEMLGPQLISLSELDQLVCVLMAIRKDFWPQAQPICVGERQ